MKKQLLLFAFSALALTSCEDDDIQAYEMDMMKGDWKISKIEVISGKDNKTVIEDTVPTGCGAKNTYHFRTDFYTKYTAYIGVGADCQINATSEGTYSYNEETKDLVISYDNETPLPYQVVILTSQEMRIMQKFDNIDRDGDQIIDYTYVTLKR